MSKEHLEHLRKMTLAASDRAFRRAYHGFLRSFRTAQPQTLADRLVELTHEIAQTEAALSRCLLELSYSRGQAILAGAMNLHAENKALLKVMSERHATAIS